MTKEQLIQLVADAGASATQYIKTEDIVLSEEFRAICEKNSCGKYGKCYMCPPFTGPIDERMREVRSYPGGVLYQSVGTLEDSFDFDGMMAAAKHHAELSREIERRIGELRKQETGDADVAVATGHIGPAVSGALPNRMLHLTNGGCDLCEICGALDGTPCRHPNLAMPSVESYGMDVYKTSRAAGLKYNNGPNTVTYFGLVLFE